MQIETERLELVLLNLRQFKLWVQDIQTLEKELDCHYQGEAMEGFFLDIVKGQIKIIENDPDNEIWHSFIFLIRKNDRVVVGSADFKDVPNSTGEVEIGYGLGKIHEHNGYMTETVHAMCGWARKQNGVSRVIAETERDGFASQKVLQRCGFEQYQRGETLWWRK